MIKTFLAWLIIAGLIRASMEVFPHFTAKKTLVSLAIATLATIILSLIVLLF